MNLNNKVFEVIGFGALNVDHLYHVDSLAAKDQESFIKNKSSSCGGSAANTVIGLSKLGITTSYIGKVANDSEGKMLLDNLEHENVDTSNISIEDKGCSGQIMGFVNDEGDRSLYVDPGVNDDIKLSDISLDLVNSSKILHLSSFVGDSFKAQNDLIDKLDDKVTLSFDPGALYVKKGLNSLKNLLKRTNILLINEIEIKTLFKHIINEDKDFSDDYNDFLNLRDSLEIKEEELCKSVAFALHKSGISTVVIKRGSKGVFALDKNEIVSESCFNVKCIDSTGAGDSFNAGFLYAKLNGYSLKNSCIIANWTASKTIQEFGASTSSPTLKDFKNDIANKKLILL